MTAHGLIVWLQTLAPDIDVRVIGERNSADISHGARPIIGTLEPTDDADFDFVCLVETGS